MTYQVLARKWRPHTFHQVVGQQHVLKALINSLEQGRLHHAYLFSGTRGVGKTTIARVVAQTYCGLGLLKTPAVIEAKRQDFVGQHLGSTAIKTSALIDSAMDGVLFIDHMVPAAAPKEEELHKIGTFCQNLDRLVYLQLLPYHALGSVTYKKLGRDYMMKSVKTPTLDMMDRCRKILRTYNITVQ